MKYQTYLKATEQSTRVLTQGELKHFREHRVLHIFCACGGYLMLWPNRNLQDHEQIHHVPLTNRCKKYKSIVENGAGQLIGSEAPDLEKYRQNIRVNNE